ncbi:MAG: alkaline phosphatase D family protein [Verrucomicrobiales bacterium]|nr:alkaline phosphatase D family protein [Verrucomicrobiales bacterium]
MSRVCLLLPFTLFGFLSACSQAPDEPSAGLGIMVGEVTENSALVQVRLTRGEELVDRDLPGVEGLVAFKLEHENGNSVEMGVASASNGNDCIARISFEDLKPGTNYVCVTSIGSSSGSLREGPIARFRTLPGIEKSEPVRFVVVTGMNYAKFHGDDRIDLEQHKLENNTVLPPPYDGPDKDLGYPALDAILKQKPHFFVGTGDNVYYDTPDNPRAETVTELRQKWHEQFVQPRYRALFAEVPTYWMIDDHDYRIDDGDNSGDYDPTPEVARQMVLEQLPIVAPGDPDAKTYRTHRVSRDLQLWFPENRMYRSDNAMEDGPDKTIWGAEQKAWLKKTLQESDATFKLLVSPTPMVGPDDLRKTDNHTNHGGFRHERDEFFSWLAETGLDQKHFYIVCGDRHWQYHAIHPTGIEEFSCGALLDANSRLGRKPGDPESTDPEGLIRQEYVQDERSGGFLQIEVQPAKGEGNPRLQFSWRDEHGKELHSTVK